MAISQQDLANEALQNLLSHKARNALAMLGIIIGVGGIVTLGILGKSIKTSIINEIKTFGVNTVSIIPSTDTNQQLTRSKARISTGMTIDDIDFIKQENQSFQYISADITSILDVTVNKESHKGYVRFVHPDIQHIQDEVLVAGRFFNRMDINLSRQVCVIEKKLADLLFKTSSGLGKDIEIGHSQYTIIGIIKTIDRGSIQSFTKLAKAKGRLFIPITDYVNQTGKKDITKIIFSNKQSTTLHQTAKDIIKLLEVQHDHQFKYEYKAMTDYIKSFNQILDNFSWLLFAATFISIVVGGIGITNVMTISVMERTKEIGIRRALGATAKEIFYNFLIEAIVISLVSGIIGIILGALFGLLTIYVSAKPIVFAWDRVLLAFIVSILTGIIAGVFPAMNASKLDLVESLRYE